ncbi:phosphoribosyltransferase family protein [Salinisphaera orenii]|uniref:Adenine phosphoribosyltransferase n=1 Tax=Salinisphaera orenii YIM 95161 TaxID=1051139 RepID=A0A423QAX4_9GAMM|nr:phosphoribosyltransferase family protein [Salinisphaera halophila]ROO37741.1 adenine phosphoribosyltransferase [Salinisphaera halophila YIM 95161]
MSPTPHAHRIDIAGLTRDLPLFEVAPGTRIAVLNVLGDTSLITAAADALSERLAAIDYDVLVTAEAKSIPLIHALAVATGMPYVVLRKNYKPYMGDALQAETRSITTGTTQTLFLDGKDRARVTGARVVLVDDVISSGSTLEAMRAIVQRADARIAAEAAILTEGERGNWQDVIALGHLPVFTDPD